MTLEEFTKRTTNTGTDFRPAIHCNDGYSFSCQGSHYHFSEPQEDVEEYKTMELGGWDLDEIDKYEKSPVAMFVPVKLIQKMIDNHGGINEIKTFKLCQIKK